MEAQLGIYLQMLENISKSQLEAQGSKATMLDIMDMLTRME